MSDIGRMLEERGSACCVAGAFETGVGDVELGRSA
jgi:hypothetical protein